MSTGVDESETIEAEEAQQYVKYAFIFYYLLKPPSFLTQGFKENNNTKENLSNSMCDFGAWADLRISRRAVVSYLDVDTRKYK